MSIFSRHNPALVEPGQALPGRSEQPWAIAARHKVLDAPVVTDEVPDGYEVAVFGLGCFWGAEEIYWKTPGVWSTSVGYAGGTTPHPTYEEVCSGRTNHTEAVRVVFDPAVVSFADLVKTFFEVHDPTQGFRQGNDVGTQYRSAIYFTSPEQEQTARELTARLRQGAGHPPPRRHHHRDPPGRRDAVLLRRGPAPAVPREEPVRLPLPRQHRREVPGLNLSCRAPGVRSVGSGGRRVRPSEGDHRMAEYLIYFNQQWVGDHPEEWFEGRGEPSMAVIEEMQAAGVLVFAGGLVEELDDETFSADATSGEVLVTDGPFVESKEWLGGLTIIDVATDEEARHWGGQDRGGLRLAAGGTPLQARLAARLVSAPGRRRGTARRSRRRPAGPGSTGPPAGRRRTAAARRRG